MKEGLLGGTLGVSSKSSRRSTLILHAGLDLSRRRLDVCLLDGQGGLVAETAVPADADGLRGLAGRLAGRRVRAVIESMNGARFVHDTLEEHGWEVLIADVQKVKGLAPLACKTDRIDARVLPAPTIRREREVRRGRLRRRRSHSVGVQGQLPVAHGCHSLALGPHGAKEDDRFAPANGAK
jgi:Transposase